MAQGSLQEIEQQIKALQVEAEKLRLAEGMRTLRVAIEKYGVGLPHFKRALGASRKRKDASRKPPTIHRNPNNPAETWTGRGRRPRWLVAALDAGYTVDQCRIDHSPQQDAMEAE